MSPTENTAFAVHETLQKQSLTIIVTSFVDDPLLELAQFPCYGQLWWAVQNIATKSSPKHSYRRQGYKWHSQSTCLNSLEDSSWWSSSKCKIWKREPTWTNGKNKSLSFRRSSSVFHWLTSCLNSVISTCEKGEKGIHRVNATCLESKLTLCLRYACKKYLPTIRKLPCGELFSSSSVARRAPSLLTHKSTKMLITLYFKNALNLIL